MQCMQPQHRLARAHGHRGGQLQRQCRRVVRATPVQQQQVEEEVLADTMLTFSRQVQLRGGQQVEVRALSQEWLLPLGDLLADTFVTSMGVPSYRTFVRRRIAAYLREHMGLPPQALVLVALLPATAGADGAPEATNGPTSSSSARSGSSSSASSSSSSSPSRSLPAAGDAVGAAMEGGGARRLAGSAEVSFHPSTRSSYMTLNPPEDCAYLCNMAVDPSCRRQGVGLALVQCVEDVALSAGRRELYLHLRLQDDAAAALYGAAGFVAVRVDGWWMALLGQDRRYLMRKALL